MPPAHSVDISDFGFRISDFPPNHPFDFGFAVGLRPTRRTVACGRIMASSFR